MPVTLQMNTLQYKDSQGNYNNINYMAGDIMGQKTVVTGSTPSITATANTRYMCGEVSTISFTPCADGVCDIVFTSGTTAAILTVPATVKWPSWFDPNNLEVNTIYELSIMDGIYGAVMTWALT